jgi:hypothetical protein
VLDVGVGQWPRCVATVKDSAMVDHCSWLSIVLCERGRCRFVVVFVVVVVSLLSLWQCRCDKNVACRRPPGGMWVRVWCVNSVGRLRRGPWRYDCLRGRRARIGAALLVRRGVCVEQARPGGSGPACGLHNRRPRAKCNRNTGSACVQ